MTDDDHDHNDDEETPQERFDRLSERLPSDPDAEENNHPMNDEDRCPGTNRQGEPCGHPAGWGVEGKSDGPCKFHGGASEGGAREGAGAPEGNQNAQSHALFSKHDGYYQDLEDDEQEWVAAFLDDLLERHKDRHDREPDRFDEEALKNIAIDFHRVAHANGYFREKGLVQTNFMSSMDGPVPVGDEVNAWAKEIRQYNESVYRRMQKHGLLDDPESQKADAAKGILEEWKRSASE